jgi:hypothetical protein
MGVMFAASTTFRSGASETDSLFIEGLGQWFDYHHPPRIIGLRWPLRGDVFRLQIDKLPTCFAGRL